MWLFLYVCAIGLTLLRQHTWLQHVSRDAWCCLVRCVALIWASSIVYRAAWRCQPLHHLMLGDGPNDCLPSDTALYPLFVLAWYLTEIIDLVVATERRKDDALLLAHHGITVLLFAVWGVRGRMHWAAVCFNAVHEVSDIFLESAKVLRRCKNNAVAQAASKHLFTTFAVSWFVLRVYYIPFNYLPATLRDPEIDGVIYRKTILSLIALLQVAQAYWTLMITRAVLRQYAGDDRLVDERERDARSK